MLVLVMEFFAIGLRSLTENNLFGQDAVNQRRRRRAKHKDFDEAIKSLVEIQLGDPIVHEHYGVGRYLGLKSRTFDENQQDFLSLEYANGSILMVPITALNLISRYSGATLIMHHFISWEVSSGVKRKERPPKHSMMLQQSY